MRTIITLLILYFLVDFSRGQSIDCLWIDYSKGEDTYCTSLDNDNDNNVFIAGYYNHLILGEYDLLSNGTSGRHNTFIAKYTTEGNINWLNHFGNTGHCMGKFIHCDMNNDVIITGDFENSFNISGHFFNSQGYDDVYLIKLNDGGDVIWTKQIRSQATLTIKSLDIDDHDNIYLLIRGSSSEYTSFDHISKKSDVLIAKYDSNGNIIWVREGPNGDDYLNSIPLTVDPSGNIYFTGTFKDTTTFADSIYTSVGYWYKDEEMPDSFYISTNDFYLAKLDILGNDKWIKVIGNYGDEIGTLSTLNSKNIFVVGYFTDSMSIDSVTNFTNGGIFLLKYDSLGILHKYKEIGSNYSVENITCDNQYVFITGIRNSDIFLDKYSLELDLVQSIQAGGTNTDYGQALAIDNNNFVYIGGVFHEIMNFGDFMIENPSADFNMFLAKLNYDLVPINIISFENNIFLSPIPVHDILIGESNFLNEKINIRIFDSMGKLILNKTILTDSSGSFEIDLSSLKKGIFCFMINNISTTIVKN